MPYLDAWERQRACRDAIVAGRGAEAFWLLEHDPVVTTGRRDAGIDPAKIGAPVVRTDRGGLATYHGPGQLVGYLMIDVVGRGGGVRSTVAGVEAGIIAWLGDRGVVGERRPGRPGVWVDGAKICAVGMHFRRGVSMHGFALNLSVDLAAFGGFDPCGIQDAGVTSLARLTGAAPAPGVAADSVGGRVVGALRKSFGDVDRICRGR